MSFAPSVKHSMKEEIDIFIVGLDISSPQVAQGIARVFGLDTRTAQRFVQNLPRVVRRAASPAIAERYVNALRSVGARVECRPSLPPPPNPEPELPAPSNASMADVAKTMEIERATQDAVERFRFAEGISPSMDPAMEAGAANPFIPKAPLVPHDMDRMPNVNLPRWSARPMHENNPYSAAPPRAHSDADLPPAFGFGVKFESDPAPASTPDESAGVAPPQARSVGLAPGAREFHRRSSPTPTPAPRRGSPSASSPAPAKGATRIALGLVVLAAIGAALWFVFR